MPRVLGIDGPYWFYFYSFDCAEPTHVHVRRENREAKFWINPWPWRGIGVSPLGS